MQLVAAHGWEEWQTSGRGPDLSNTGLSTWVANVRETELAVEEGSFWYEVTKRQDVVGRGAFAYTRGPLHHYWSNTVQPGLLELAAEHGTKRVCALYQKIIDLLGPTTESWNGPTGATGPEDFARMFPNGQVNPY